MPALAQPPHQREEHLDLVLGERRGRLVHDEQPRVERERLDDLDDLLLRDRERGARACRGRERGLADSSSSRAVRRSIAAVSTSPRRVGSRPRKTFSATVRSGSRLNSW